MSKKKRGEKTYEESFVELTSVVERLQQGDLPLEETIALFERGVRLSKECEAFLDEAGRRIDVLLQGEDGELVVDELDVPEE